MTEAIPPNKKSLKVTLYWKFFHALNAHLNSYFCILTWDCKILLWLGHGELKLSAPIDNIEHPSCWKFLLETSFLAQEFLKFRWQVFTTGLNGTNVASSSSNTLVPANISLKSICPQDKNGLLNMQFFYVGKNPASIKLTAYLLPLSQLYIISSTSAF